MSLDHPLESPAPLSKRFQQLKGRQRSLATQEEECDKRLKELEDWLRLEGSISTALETLSQDLFQKITSLLQEKLTIALQEVLEQGLVLKVDAEYKRSSAAISFRIERDGNSENILKGMGGSVANVLSVGLRLFALTTLDPKEHRRFLVLDEQDCWLRPDIVPRLVKIIHDACEALQFQVLMISHHDAGIFQEYADRVIRLEPGKDGVSARTLDLLPSEPDSEPLPSGD